MGRQTRVRETATVSVSLAFLDGGFAMPRGSKSAYTDKQQRKAEHIEESYRRRGVDKDEAAARAWATVNAQDGGGRRGGNAKARTARGRSRTR